ncbi:Uu.00g113200.m01.CDS01 [Anthostomella pinea]|uniref:Uu.00g113200.m01.CDS01 n=1 Tax=Anthostomella pinea TaxID=933095 RepID=A0AAI8VG45_9PEZI|nr:Uu.00g113200.m01.CDS01 [Anthostomella pinea]
MSSNKESPAQQLSSMAAKRSDERQDERQDEPKTYEICGICQEEENEIEHTTLPCNHSFHPECIRKWLSYCQTQPTCPNCRENLAHPGCCHPISEDLFTPGATILPGALATPCEICLGIRDVRTRGNELPHWRHENLLRTLTSFSDEVAGMFGLAFQPVDVADDQGENVLFPLERQDPDETGPVPYFYGARRLAVTIDELLEYISITGIDFHGFVVRRQADARIYGLSHAEKLAILLTDSLLSEVHRGGGRNAVRAMVSNMDAVQSAAELAFRNVMHEGASHDEASDAFYWICHW